MTAMLAVVNVDVDVTAPEDDGEHRERIVEPLPTSRVSFNRCHRLTDKAELPEGEIIKRKITKKPAEDTKVPDNSSRMFRRFDSKQQTDSGVCLVHNANIICLFFCFSVNFFLSKYFIMPRQLFRRTGEASTNISRTKYHKGVTTVIDFSS